jgi:hypothetical protein
MSPYETTRHIPPELFRSQPKPLTSLLRLTTGATNIPLPERVGDGDHPQSSQPSQPLGLVCHSLVVLSIPSYRIVMSRPVSRPRVSITPPQVLQDGYIPVVLYHQFDYSTLPPPTSPLQSSYNTVHPYLAKSHPHKPIVTPAPSSRGVLAYLATSSPAAMGACF